MNRALYISGFQEQDNKKSPRRKIQQKCKNNGITFDNVITPGDTSSGNEIDTKFSMYAWREVIKNKISDILVATNDCIDIYAYSLAARPTIDAILELSGEYQKRITLYLIHPAYNPLHAIKVMDWFKDDKVNELKNDDHYLTGNVDNIFNTLISGWEGYNGWIGDAKQFQRDLKSYVNRGFFTWEEFLKYMESLPFNTNLIGDGIEDDRIIHDLQGLGYSKGGSGARKVQFSHLPKGL